MKNMVAGLLILGGLVAFPVQANETDMVEKAKRAAHKWLQLTDHHKYAKSWTQASSYFQSAIDKPTWVGAMNATRKPLGRVKSRTLKFSSFSETLPNAPKGKYVVLQYSTVFEGKPDALETVTPMLDKDGTWKVAGYFIK
ncbi:MAG: DUF4019 domain-containing protein [Candidatus Sericytochromatia bacterium]|nr:DUF4019 domain-containing protein [Candidatus Sericytochromatia bacterium]